MAEYTVALLESAIVAEGTMAFRFEKPAGFEFKAGNSIDLTLIDPSETDWEGNTRAFSIAASPQEDHLMIASRMRDTAFKRVLATLQAGDKLKFSGPYGSFTLHNALEKPAVFLTGGIGITPVRSILLDAKARALPHRIFVFYSNRRPEDAAFLDELTALTKEMPNVSFIPTMTDMSKSQREWGGATGYINAEMVRKELPDTANAIFYIDGPATMVAAMRQMLRDMHADEDNIRIEEFAGY